MSAAIRLDHTVKEVLNYGVPWKNNSKNTILGYYVTFTTMMAVVTGLILGSFALKYAVLLY